jgi:cellulose synthase/poly-beta-1,6-N-acetylglucosamine synthase-like glycosyltransferase
MSIGMNGLYRNHILHDGWKWFGLSEDCEMSMDIVSKGYRTTFVASAISYIEHPKKIKLLLQQSMRWSRGSFIAYFRYVLFNILGIIMPIDWLAKKEKREKIKRPKQNIAMHVLEQIQKRASCFDMIFHLIPLNALTIVTILIYPMVTIFSNIGQGNLVAIYILQSLLYIHIVMYLTTFIGYACALAREYKRIHATPTFLLYIFIWPIIDTFLSTYLAVIAYLTPVKWKQIKRYDTRNIDNIKEIPPIEELGGKKNPIKYYSLCLLLMIVGIFFLTGGILMTLNYFLLFTFIPRGIYIDVWLTIPITLVGMAVTAFSAWKLVSK